MQYMSRRPTRPLDDLIEDLWWLSDAPPHARELILPSGTLELVINLSENEFRIYDTMPSAPRLFSGAIVSGAYRRPFVIDTLVRRRSDRVKVNHVVLPALVGSNSSKTA